MTTISITRDGGHFLGRKAIGSAALAVSLVLSLMISSGTLDAQRRQDPPKTCPNDQLADGYAQQSLGPLDLGVEGDATDYQTAGATLEYDESGDDLVLIVTYQGTQRRLSTQGHDIGGYYANRGPGPADTEYGTVVVTTGARTWLTFGRGTSGQVTGFAWTLDGPCAAAPAPATGAPAVEGSANYTG